MPAAVKNLVIEQKVTFRKRLTYRNKAKRPINLTGWSARLQIRDASGNIIADLSTTNGKIVLGGAAGTIDIVISEAETTAMSFTTALYDLKLIQPDGESKRFLQGKVTLSLGQTL